MKYAASGAGAVVAQPGSTWAAGAREPAAVDELAVGVASSAWDSSTHEDKSLDEYMGSSAGPV